MPGSWGTAPRTASAAACLQCRGPYLVCLSGAAPRLQHQGHRYPETVRGRGKTELTCLELRPRVQNVQLSASSADASSVVLSSTARDLRPTVLWASLREKSHSQFANLLYTQYIKICCNVCIYMQCHKICPCYLELYIDSYIVKS